MNLNKYHPTGREYTPEEACKRAMAFFRIRYVCQGYEADPIKRMAQARIYPYNVGRNALKRRLKGY